MADLRKRFLEDYAGGFLNVARQEISSAGEVLVQDGFTSQGTLFVEDGAGVKSGLKLGVSLAEAIDPTTPQGIVNVRYADRTFAKIRDLKIFSTAIASAQAALSEATSVSITNLESSLQILEDSITANNQNVDNTVNSLSNTTSLAISTVNELSSTVSTLSTDVQNLSNRVLSLEGGGSNAPSIANLDTSINFYELDGTIAISNGVVTGTDTTFSADLNVGDTIFVAYLDESQNPDPDPLPVRLRDFRITSFDTINSATQMSVTPTNITVGAGAHFYRSESQEIKNKINEILDALKNLNFVQ